MIFNKLYVSNISTAGTSNSSEMSSLSKLTKDDNERTKMSHNIYSEDNEITSTYYNKYLILIENELRTEIIPCTCLTNAIDIAKSEQSLCRIFERRGSMGKQWTYLCDVSRGVI